MTGGVFSVLGTGARRVAPAAGLLLLLLALLAACGDGDAGLTRAEVEEIVASEMAASQPRGAVSPGMAPSDVEAVVADAVAAMAQPEPGLTPAEVEAIVNDAIAAMAQPEPGLTPAEVEAIVNDAITAMPPHQPGLTPAEAEQIARAAIAAVPSKSAPAEYTQHFVESAIARYGAKGLEATVAHYSRPESIDGQWYVFIIDDNDLVIAHPDPERLGLDLNGWVGTDTNGYNFGPEMLSATEDGKWVSYVYRNPESGGIGSGDFELKNVWTVRHDGLLFASGWYIDADEFTKHLVSVAVDKFREEGLAGTVAYFASPASALAGLEAAVAYHNAAETIDGRWFAFIGGPDGKIAAHSDTSMIGRDTQDLFGSQTLPATAEGDWVESESRRVWVAQYGGHTFGSGWNRDN